MSTGISVQKCATCGHTHFPPTAVCPRCWGDHLIRTRCTTGEVEDVTSIDSGRVRIASLRTAAGPLVVGSLQQGKPGDVVALTERPGEPGAAFVPSDPRAGDALPQTRSALRDLDPARLTVPQLLQHQAHRYPDKPLLVCDDTVWTYRDTATRAARAASGLRGRGIATGDRVAMWCDNRPELLETVLGCAWLGAIAVPLNTALRGPGLRHTLADSGARALFVDHERLPMLAEVELPETLQEVWLPNTQEPATAQESLDLSVTGRPLGTEQSLPAEVGPGDTMAILYTSGTTGLPKGVCCPHAQFYWWGVTVSECLEIDEDDVLYTCLPLFHTNALNAFFQAVVAGATFVLGSRFSASRFWSELADSGATVTYLLGAMVQILCARPDDEYDARHRTRIALSPATPAHSHQEFSRRFGITLVDGFGSTETNMLIGADASVQRPGQMGVTLPDFETRVVDQRGLDVAAGTPGELLCRARQPFAFATGYFNNTEATAQGWAGRWFRTGDRVVQDDDGWFTFLDRIKDSIRRRGENISSLEVEQVLTLHPAIESAAAFPVPSDLAEDEVMVAVVPSANQSVDPRELIAYCESKLPYFAVPRYLDVVDTLPLTENGKVQKTALRSRGVGDSTWDRCTDD